MAARNCWTILVVLLMTFKCLYLSSAVYGFIPESRRASQPPLATTPQWGVWYESLLARRLAEAPRERSVSIHFSQGGNDQTGTGSADAPLRSLARAQQIVNGLPVTADVALLFRRGDVWREQVGLSVSNAEVTIADYGDANLPKPIFTPFVPAGDRALWSAAPGLPGVWRRPAGNAGPITWVRQTEDLSVVLSRQATLLGCASTVGSWHYDAATDTLYVHPHPGAAGPLDPRTSVDEFFVVRPTSVGVMVRGDRSRVENIVAIGWGMRTTTPSQEHGINSFATNGDRVVIAHCESYYGSSHAMVHAASGAGGGITTFYHCKAGFCQFNGSAGETIFNTYSFFGESETIFESCITVAGTLPSSEWDISTTRRGTGFYGHAGGLVGGVERNLGLVVMRNCSILPGPFACVQPSNLNDLPRAERLADARAFIVNETFTGDHRPVDLPLASIGMVRMNGSYTNMRMNNQQVLVSFEQSGWLINCTVELTIAVRSGWVALYFTRPSLPFRIRMIANHFRFRTQNAGADFRIDLNEPNSSAGSVVVNNIFSHTGPGTARFNVGRAGDEVAGNAFFGFTLAGGTAASALWRRNIVLTIEPTMFAVPSCGSPLANLAQPTADGNPLMIDAAGTVHSSAWRTAIGPREIAPCADLTLDGRIDAEDLFEFERQPRDLTGDGLITADDRRAVELAVRRGEMFADPLSVGR